MKKSPRSISITGDGISDAILVPSSRSSYWIMSIGGDFAGGAQCTLQASKDGDNWFNPPNGYSDCIFDRDTLLLISSGLYYRFLVQGFTSEITVNIRPR